MPSAMLVVGETIPNRLQPGHTQTEREPLEHDIVLEYTPHSPVESYTLVRVLKKFVNPGTLIWKKKKTRSHLKHQKERGPAW